MGTAVRCGLAGVTSTILVAGFGIHGASASSSVCGGVKNCTLVSRADVDGDGRTDQIGLVEPSANGGERLATVRVRTATGKILTTKHSSWWYPESTWAGAARIDGRKGHELVLGTSMGAHYMEFRVITYRNGRLTTLQAPGGYSRWGIDSSYSFNAGYTRTTTAKGSVVMTQKWSTRSSETRHDLHTSRYVWTGSKWKRTKYSVNRYATNRQAAEIGGWRVPYLKRFPALS